MNHGIHLLRDQGLQYNPGSAKLYWELGWLFQHKLGADFDTAHLHYKREWASDMTRLLGGARPDYDTLLDAPRSREELLSDPQTARWVRQRQKDGVDVLATSFLDDTNLPEPV
ncbi:MAG: hypothetical protein GWO24_29370, partial [Akkermansiaceae bacterium]|nr:hypothetical protein [Akkermansiaceae bacterium]